MSGQKSKHGIWFPFDRHIDIHRNVISGWKTSMVTPCDYTETWESPTEHKFEIEFEFRVNGYKVKIFKISSVSFKTLRSNKRFPDRAMTVDYNYVAYNKIKNHMIRYCSPHASTYQSDRPWHHKHHRHEVNGTSEEVTIYSNDDRPLIDRLKRKFYVKNNTVTIQYINVDWPHISEFLTEIYNL